VTFFTFLASVLEEILVMEKLGLAVNVGQSTHYYKVRLCLSVGDIPGIAELCRHSGHTSYKGCRVCIIKGTRVEGKGGIYFPNIDYTSGNCVSYPIISRTNFTVRNEVLILM
jgi:hypothetical protein